MSLTKCRSARMIAETVEQRVLYWLVDYPLKEFMACEIGVDASVGAIRKGLKKLKGRGFVKEVRRGAFSLWELVDDDCYVEQYKRTKEALVGVN